MKIRQLIIAALLISFFYSCKQDEGNTQQGQVYTIYGKTTFNITKPILLHEIIGGNLKNKDSLNITGMNFTFTGKLDEPNFYMISLKESGSYVFPIDSTPVSVEISGTPEMPVFRVTGSRLNDDFEKVYAIRLKSKQRFDSLNQAIILAENMQNKSIVESLKKRISATETQLTRELKSLINTSEKSIVSVYAASLLDTKTNMGFLDSLSVSLAPLAKRSFTVNKFVENVQKLKGAQLGNKVSDFTGNAPDGKKISLSDFKGKIVLLDFWASWCGPCRRESPNLVRIYNKFKNKNFDILGISLDTEADKWKNAIADDQLAWNHISDLKGWDSEFGAMFNIESIPQTFLLDQEGKIIARNLQGEALEKKLEEILN